MEPHVRHVEAHYERLNFRSELRKNARGRSYSWCNSRTSLRNVVTVISLIQTRNDVQVHDENAGVRVTLSKLAGTFRALGRQTRRSSDGLRLHFLPPDNNAASNIV